MISVGSIRNSGRAPKSRYRIVHVLDPARRFHLREADTEADTRVLWQWEHFRDPLVRRVREMCRSVVLRAVLATLVE